MDDLSDISHILGSKEDLSDVSNILGSEQPAPAVAKEKPLYIAGRGGVIKTTPTEQTEMLKAMGRGAVKGVLGTPGELEKFGAYTVPEFFGAEKTPESQQVEIFPTSKTVGEMLGFQKTPEKYQPVESLSEILGGLASPFAAEKAASGAGTAVKETGRAARAAVSPEASLSARIAEPGSTKALGESIIEKSADRLKNIREGRAEEAAALFENFYRDARPVQDYIREGYVQDLKNYLIQNQGKLSADKEQVIRDAIKRVRPDAKIEALDEERRILAESIDPAATGADVIKNDAYRTAHDLLMKNITQRVKSAQDTLNRYAEMSQEINQYGTTLGKKLTRKAGEFLPDVSAVEPEKIPNAAFSNETNVATLKRLTGDPKFVEDAARQHIANELTGDLKPAKVKKYIQDNKWLNEVPNVKAELEGLAGELSRGKKLRYGAYLGAGLVAGSPVLSKLGKFIGD